jgi:hypothetical protein
MSAFNRHRRQQEALKDAQARDDEAQAKPVSEKYSDDEMAKFAENNDLMGSPPYADVDGLINIPADADPKREEAAMRQAEKNRDRVPTDEDRWHLQNAHFRDAKVKAIPDFDEAGQDRTLAGQHDLRAQASKPYEDPRSPTLDGRERVAEPWEERPDSDTSVSKKTRRGATKPVLDDDPNLVERIVDKGERPTEGEVPDASMSPTVPAPEPAPVPESPATEPPATEPPATEPPAPDPKGAPPPPTHVDPEPPPPPEPPPEPAPEPEPEPSPPQVKSHTSRRPPGKVAKGSPEEA